MLEIRTNNVPRNTIYAYELTPKEQEEFNYMDNDEIQFHDFVRYKGKIYDTSEFMRTSDTPEFSSWEGYLSQTFFSGILIRYCKEYNNEKVIMGEYYAA